MGRPPRHPDEVIVELGRRSRGLWPEGTKRKSMYDDSTALDLLLSPPCRLLVRRCSRQAVPPRSSDGMCSWGKKLDRPPPPSKHRGDGGTAGGTGWPSSKQSKRDCVGDGVWTSGAFQRGDHATADHELTHLSSRLSSDP